MIWRFMDWLDELVGYDRAAVRALLIGVVIPVLVVGAFSVYSFATYSPPAPAPEVLSEDDIDRIVGDILHDVQKEARPY